VALRQLIALAESGDATALCIGRQAGKLHFTDLADLPMLVEPRAHRPREQRWLALRSLARKMAELRPPT
jgi:hypothetical protein